MHNEPQRQWLHADLAGCAAIFAMIEYGETDETNYSRWSRHIGGGGATNS